MGWQSDDPRRDFRCAQGVHLRWTCGAAHARPRWGGLRGEAGAAAGPPNASQPLLLPCGCHRQRSDVQGVAEPAVSQQPAAGCPACAPVLPLPSPARRAAGFISLEALCWMAARRHDTFVALMRKQHGVRSAWEYPFAAGGVNVAFMLVQLLELHTGGSEGSSAGSAGSAVAPASAAARGFLPLLVESDAAFEELFTLSASRAPAPACLLWQCPPHRPALDVASSVPGFIALLPLPPHPCAAYQVLDAVWLEQGASYMQFPQVSSGWVIDAFVSWAGCAVHARSITAPAAHPANPATRAGAQRRAAAAGAWAGQPRHVAGSAAARADAERGLVLVLPCQMQCGAYLQRAYSERARGLACKRRVWHCGMGVQERYFRRARHAGCVGCDTSGAQSVQRGRRGKSPGMKGERGWGQRIRRKDLKT